MPGPRSSVADELGIYFIPGCRHLLHREQVQEMMGARHLTRARNEREWEEARTLVTFLSACL